MNNEAIKNAKANDTLWDNGSPKSVKGLHLRVTPTGVKNFMLYYRTKGGKQRRPKIGESGDITLAEARIRAKKILDQVAIGDDPKGNWDRTRAELTLKDLYNKALNGHWNQERYQTSGWRADVVLFWTKHIEPKLGSRGLSELTPNVLRAWHQSMILVPYAANRSLRVLSKIFSFAEQRELIPLGTNPCRLVAAHKEKKRKRLASEAEIKKIGPILDREASAHPSGVAFLYLLLLTGSRPSAIERATWDQLQTIHKDGLKYGILTFDGKSTNTTGEEEIVIIPPAGMALIEKLPRISGGTITNCLMPHKLWRKVRLEAGCEDLWARDFRRTFATIGMSNGVNKDVVGKLLNHHSSQTTDIYAKLNHDSRVKAATQIAGRLEAILESGRNESFEDLL